MVQLVALQARGTRYDPARVMADAERIRAGRIANESNEISLGEQRDEATALSQYRDQAQAGDPNAISALNGYPAHQRKILDALDGMSAEEVQGALNRAREINEAANYVASFPQGTPEREAAWAEQIGDLEQKGYVTPDQAKAWIEQGPSDLMLQDAIGTTDFVLGQYGSGKAAINAAKVNTEEARAGKYAADTDLSRAKTDTEGKRGKKIEADTGLTVERGETEEAKQGKYGADTELSRARTENVEADTVADTELSKAKTGKAQAETGLAGARTGQVKNKTQLETEESGAKVKKVGADTELSRARTNQVRNKTGLETAESAAEVDETKAKTGKVKMQTRQVEGAIENERDLARARIADYQASAQARGNTTDGRRGDASIKDRLAVDEAIRQREKELGLDFPLPDDATPEEIKEREAAEAAFEGYKNEWLALLPKGPSGKQGPAAIGADGITKPAKGAGLQGAGTEKEPYTGFTREEFNRLPVGAIYINPKDKRLLRKKPADGAAGR
ncbi:MAG: hypothetical protein E6Q97_24800 [Desulfurellales bacterium]|nr:MAG: hypothetical protein E6Q97_24800 [Desulfurellales bacterium]